MPQRGCAVKWLHGFSAGQEYWYPEGMEFFQVVRNLDESHWVIYDTQGGGVRMLPNPGHPTARLSFCEVTDIPAAGESFGDRPHHDRISDVTDSVNYAWDTEEDARAHVESLLQ